MPYESTGAIGVLLREQEVPENIFWYLLSRTLSDAAISHAGFCSWLVYSLL